MMAASTRQTAAKGLTPESFACLLSKLGEDTREAGGRYELLRQRLVVFFLRRLLGSPEDLADEVIDRLARRLAEGEDIASIEAYALGIARHVALEQHAVGLREGALPDSFLRNSSTVKSTTDEELLRKEGQLDAMERSLERLPKKERQLLNEYYLAEPRETIASRRRIAMTLGMTQAALRKKIYLLCLGLRAAIDEETK